MKRIKRRYLALKLECESIPGEREFIDALWSSITRLFGEVGASLTGLTVISFDVEHRIAVVRCSLASLPMVRSSVAALTKITGNKASVHIIAVSGTLKALFSNI